jgi:tryptophan 7-halogenase
MNHGWCWRIEHENVINRGYVYSSDMVSDDEAFEEFKRKNPKVPDDPRIVPFRSGCYRRLWLDNVVAVGNAGGFVEPLEATAMMAIVFQCQLLSDLLHDSVYEPTDSIRKLYNTRTSGTWEEIRDFLGLHYVRHTPGETPYWRRCQNETDLSGIADLLEFYEQNGPSRYCQNLLPTSMSSFGIEGYLVMLVGTQAPYTNRYEPTKHELKAFREHRSFLEKRARKGIGVKEVLGSIRSPRWKWMDEK